MASTSKFHPLLRGLQDSLTAVTQGSHFPNQYGCSWRLRSPTELIRSAGTADGSCFGYSVDSSLKNTFYDGHVSAPQALTPSNSRIRSNIAPPTFTIICPKPFSCYIESTYVILIHQIMQCWQIDHIIFISLIFDSWMIFVPILVIKVCAFADAT